MLKVKEKGYKYSNVQFAFTYETESKNNQNMFKEKFNI